jgi:hypothetical protein
VFVRYQKEGRSLGSQMSEVYSEALHKTRCAIMYTSSWPASRVAKVRHARHVTSARTPPSHLAHPAVLRPTRSAGFKGRCCIAICSRMSDTRPDASGSKSNDDAQHHHRDGVAAGTAQANDTRATSAELDREGEQATKRKRSRITQACRRCKTVS